MGVHWKTWFLGEVLEKIKRGEIGQKWELGHAADLRGGLGKKEGVVFLRGWVWHPNANYVSQHPTQNSLFCQIKLFIQTTCLANND